MVPEDFGVGCTALSLVVIQTDSESLNEPSVTEKEIVEVPTWAIAGVQAKVLVVGLKVALAGRLVAE